MAASVEILENTANKRLFAKLLFTWSSADETNVVKLDASALSIPENGTATIKNIFWTVSAGGNYVELIWDGATNKTIAYLSGTGDWNFNRGIVVPNTALTPTGDLLVSTSGFVSGDSYTVFLELKI